ncbi:methylenetetrahydrofolate reductase [NAD(P)H] [Mangrovicoccus algicola]|uniref:Methylenetetrahydrofolate reductase n=1 Tax=Mangrovicoccus algicola TaxID=2771008 RepID=A0A8J6YYJ0_9RHOB|nr:methylenetetrahydrofolate reductase [NAD(P)H] [Mangrovicoccus algicola]MBE3640307.1 methylenetetrahydrofolate reductase [NAD(P)H] [Mangrovicoccus algicola]
MSAPRVSFEFFPPRSLEASFRLWDTVRALAPLRPTFVSVTYGAGGTTRKLTHEAVTTIGKNYGLNVAAHLTCVDASRAETLEIAQSYAEAGVTELVALRGDPPKGADRFTAHPEGFADACELIAALKETGQFTLRVGAYPDPHPEAKGDPLADVRWLARKFEAGADSAITQFFFEPDTFFRFRDRCAAAGISAPVIPGILPIENWTGVRKFALRCGTPVPAWLDEAFDKAGPEGQDALSRDLCIDLCRRLMAEGVEDLHFYTLNKPGLSRDICAALGVHPQGALEDVA